MPESWKVPVSTPLFTDAYAQELVDKAKTQPPKPKAFDTRHRYSNSGRCERQEAYDDLGVEAEQWSAASLHVAAVGTFYHEHCLQPAILRRYPGASIEVKSQIVEADSSGHCDALAHANVITTYCITWEGGRTLYELKTKSTAQMDFATGISRKSYKQKDPDGPKLDVILQAGMNAVANGCDTVVIGYVCFENYGVPLARKFNLREMDRFIAEWHIPADVWRPLVDMEIERLRQLDATIDLGYLPDRRVWDEDHIREMVTLNPELAKPPWQCDYCSHVNRCLADGPGCIPIPVDIRPKETA